MQEPMNRIAQDRGATGSLACGAKRTQSLIQRRWRLRENAEVAVRSAGAEHPVATPQRAWRSGVAVRQRPRQAQPGVTLRRVGRGLHRRHKERQYSNAWSPAQAGPRINLSVPGCWSEQTRRFLLFESLPLGPRGLCAHFGTRNRRRVPGVASTLVVAGERRDCHTLLSCRPNQVRRRCPGKLPKIKHLQHTRGTPHYKGRSARQGPRRPAPGGGRGV